MGPKTALNMLKFELHRLLKIDISKKQQKIEILR